MTHFSSLIVWLGLLIIVPASSWADNINSHHSLTAKISNLTAIELKPGLNTVDFWGPFHERGMIFQSDVDTNTGPNQLFMVIAPWKTPFNTMSLPYALDTSSAETGNFLIGNNSFDGQYEIQTVLFCNGTLVGKKRTFLIVATKQLIASDDGDAPRYVDPQPVRISIYGFSSGSPLNDASQYSSVPSFRIKIDTFLTTRLYCSSDDAIPLELPVKFSQRRTLKNGRTVKYFSDPSNSSTGCP